MSTVQSSIELAHTLEIGNTVEVGYNTDDGDYVEFVGTWFGWASDGGFQVAERGELPRGAIMVHHFYAEQTERFDLVSRH